MLKDTHKNSSPNQVKTGPNMLENCASQLKKLEHIFFERCLLSYNEDKTFGSLLTKGLFT